MVYDTKYPIEALNIPSLKLYITKMIYCITQRKVYLLPLLPKVCASRDLPLHAPSRKKKTQ